MHADEWEWFGNVADKLSHRGTASVLIVFTGDDGEDDGSAAEEAVSVTEDAGA